MKRRYRFHRDAQAEYLAAIDWYGERSEASARGFADLVEAGLRGIRGFPLAWPQWPRRADVRVRVLRRYPYSIIYLVEDDGEILIVAVAHQKRRPGYWSRRIAK